MKESDVVRFLFQMKVDRYNFRCMLYDLKIDKFELPEFSKSMSKTMVIRYKIKFFDVPGPV